MIITDKNMTVKTTFNLILLNQIKLFRKMVLLSKVY